MVRQLIRWSKELIIETLQKLNEEKADLRDGNSQKEHRKLYRAAQAHLGSWKKALKKAKIKYSDVEERIYRSRREQEKIQLLKDLKIAHDSGVKLNRGNIINDPDHRILYWSSKKFYKGKTFWEDVLSDAGLNPLEIVLQQRWTRKKVKEELLDRREKGLALNSGAITREKGASGLAHAIMNHFDSHRAALIYAGINPNTVTKARTYTNQELVEFIISAHIKGKDLSYSSIKSKKDKHLRRVFYVASRRFKGLRNALKVCGIDSEQYFETKEWDKEKVKSRIEKLAEEGVELHSSSIQKKDLLVYKAGMRYFGSWEKAINAAGLDYEKINQARESLSEEELVLGVQKLAREGKSLNLTSMIEDKDHLVRRLVTQSYNRFDGGWEEALERAGFDPDKIRKTRRKYSFRELKERVLEMHNLGIDLAVSSIKENPESCSIYRSISRRFSTWYDFLDKVGIDSSKYRKAGDWKNGEGVIETLKEMFPSGIMTGVRGKDNNLAAAICKYFKTVKNAAEKAELVYSRGGKISKQYLEEHPEAMGLIYNCNDGFIQNIADKVFYGALGRKIPSEDRDDLKQEAFFIFMELLPKKPAKADLRDFIYEPIYRGLISLNWEHAKHAKKEHLWGDNAYFELAGMVDESYNQE